MPARKIRICDNCGNEIPANSQNGRSKSRSGKRSVHKFCNRDCYDAYRVAVREANAKPCATCGKIMDAPSTVKTRKYCSWECKLADTRAKPVNCLSCGCWFTAVKPIKRSFGIQVISHNPRDGRVTCSSECHHAWIRDNPERKRKISEAITAEKHPNWMGGSHRIGYRGVGWQKIRERVRRAAGFKCEHCGMSEDDHMKMYGCTLHVNHKVPYHQHASGNPNKPSNLEALCRSCHTKADWKWRKDHPQQLTLAKMYSSSMLKQLRSVNR